MTRLSAGQWRNYGSSTASGKRVPFSPKHHNKLWGPTSLTFTGYWHPTHQADHSPPSSTQAKKRGIALHPCPVCLQIMHRDSFTLYIKLAGVPGVARDDRWWNISRKGKERL